MAEQKSVTQLFNELNNHRFKERAYYSFKRTSEKILQKIEEMQKEGVHDREMDLMQAAYRLSHTIGKEVDFIKYHEDRMHKKGAAKVREKEYYDSIDQAIKQIEADIIMVLIVEKDCGATTNGATSL
jgi:hypothetical protein